MKNFLTISVLMLASMACAQNVIITGTVKDPTGAAYQGGSGRVVLTPSNVQWLYGTNPVPTPITISGLDSFGHFSISLMNTGIITPASMNPQWTFSFCSQTYSAQPIPVCFTMTPMSLTTSQDITTQIQAQSALLPNIGTITGVTANGGLALTGSTIGMLTTCAATQVEQWNGIAWACAAAGSGGGLADPGTNGPIKRTGLNVTAPAAASDIVGLFSTCSGTQYLGADGSCHTGGGSPGGSNTQIQINNSSAFGAISNASAGSVLASQGTSTAPVFQTKLIYDARDYGVVANGSTDDTAHVAAAVAAIGSSPARLVLPSGQTAVYSANIPTNITLDFSAGGSFKVLTNTTTPGLGAFVQGNGTTNLTATNSCSVTLTGTTPGNAIVYMGQTGYFGSISGEPIMSAPTGGGTIFSPIWRSGGYEEVDFGYAAANIPGGTVTVTAPISQTTPNTCMAWELSGMGPSITAGNGSFGAASADTGLMTSANSPGSAVTTTTGSFLIGFGGQLGVSTNATCTHGSGWTQPAGAAGQVDTSQVMCAEYIANGAGGATTATQTLSAWVLDGGLNEYWVYSLMELQAGNTTLHILGGIVDPDLHQIFYGATGTNGSVDFTGNTGITEVEPEWTGAGAAVAPATNTLALQAAEHQAFGSKRINGSGLSQWNKVLALNAQYPISGPIQFYDVIGGSVGRWKVDCKNGGMTITTASTMGTPLPIGIIDAQSTAYGTFHNCLWMDSSGTNTAPKALTVFDYSGITGADLRPQFLDFYSNTWQGNGSTDVGILIAPSGGGAQGSNINLYNPEGAAFSGAAYQTGGDGVGRNAGRSYATNAIVNMIINGDFQGNPNYAVATYGGNVDIEGTSFEDGFTTQLLAGNGESSNKAGYDIYCFTVQAPCEVHGVRSESRKLIACDGCNVSNSYTINQAIQVGAGPAPWPLGYIIRGTDVAWDGQYYQVTANGSGGFGGVGTQSNPVMASSGSPTTLVDTNETVAGKVSDGIFILGETLTQGSTGSTATLLDVPVSQSNIAGILTSGVPVYAETATQTGTSATGLVYSNTPTTTLVVTSLTGSANGSGTWVGTSGFIFTPSGSPVTQPSNPVMLITAATASPDGTHAWTGGTSTAVYTPTVSPAATANWTTNAFTGMFVSVVDGTNAGCYGTVTSNTATSITLTGGWTTKYYGLLCSSPAVSSLFTVEPAWNGGSGPITSGDITLTPMNEDIISGVASSAGAGGNFDNVRAPGGRLFINPNSRVYIGGTRPDWYDPAAGVAENRNPYDSNDLLVVVNQHITRGGIVYYQAMPSIVQGATGYSGLLSRNIGITPFVWGCGDGSNGSCNDVWIGGRSTPVHNDAHLEFGGIFEPRVPTTPLGNPLNQNGANAIFGAGRGTGSGTPGIFQWLLSTAGASGTTPQTESAAMTLGASGLNLSTGGTVPSGTTLTIASGGTLTCASGSTCPGVGATTINPQSGTPYVLALTDENVFVIMTDSAANIVTVPLNSSVAFPVGTTITVRQDGTGTTTISPSGGVTVNTPSSLVLRVRFASVQLIKVATDTWDLMGDTQ